MQNISRWQACLLQVVAFIALSWLFLYLVPMNWFITFYLPWSFWLLVFVALLGIVGLGWPFAPPMGIWKPGMSLAVPGLGMSALWIVFSLVMLVVETKVWPAVPMFPVGLWMGLLFFFSAAWWFCSGINPSPFAHGGKNLLLATVAVSILGSVIWVFAVNLKGTPFEGASFDFNGLFQVEWFFGFVVWWFAWMQTAALTFGGWPFYKAGKVLHPVLLTVVTGGLGYICWTGSLSLGISPTFSFGALGATIIIWSLLQPIFFEWYPFRSVVQPMRGVYGFLLGIVFVPVWIGFLKYGILVPILPRLQATGMPFDANALMVFFGLHCFAPWLLVHNFFWLRAPLVPPEPPLGPEETRPEPAVDPKGAASDPASA